MKKLIAIMLALTLVLGMANIAFAAEEKPWKVAILTGTTSLSQPSWNLVKAESDESGLKSSIMRTPV